MKSNYDLIIWIFIFLLIAFIFGLYIAENQRIPKSLYMRTVANSSTPYIEQFTQKSSSFDVAGGASSKYGWGISDDYEREVISKKKEVSQEAPKACKKDNKKDEEKCVQDSIFKSQSELCKKCDIMTNPDIDKYVLKSSVPPCPNMNEYIKKSEIPACPNINLDEYIKKSEIPAPKECPKINLDEYIKKSEVPPQKECPTCPEIPKCPTCPEIPEDIKQRKEVKNIREFNIEDVKNVLNDKKSSLNIQNNEDVEMILQDKRIREYLDENYEKKNPNIPKENNQEENEIKGYQPKVVESEAVITSENKYEASSSLWEQIKSFFSFNIDTSKFKLPEDNRDASTKFKLYRPERTQLDSNVEALLSTNLSNVYNKLSQLQLPQDDPNRTNKFKLYRPEKSELDSNVKALLSANLSKLAEMKLPEQKSDPAKYKLCKSEQNDVVEKIVSSLQSYISSLLSQSKEIKLPQPEPITTHAPAPAPEPEKSPVHKHYIYEEEVIYMPKTKKIVEYDVPTEKCDENKSSIRLNKLYYNDNEEKKMIYNNSCNDKNNKYCDNYQLSDSGAMYAGDSLYSVANF
jgi:hypothetical protein